jgi:hypothetical protein
VSYEDDERMERFREAMESQRKRHESEMLAVAEQSLTDVSSNECPPPLSWHPFYRGKTWLIDWLNGESSLPEWDIMIPIPTRPVWASITADPGPIDMPTVKAMRMSKQRAWGPAPWVGKPFHYEWFVGTDELGRRVAGESRIVYEEGIRMFQAMGLHP